MLQQIVHDGPDWGRILETGIAVVILPLLGWMAKGLTEIRIVLVGIDGKNGMRGELKALTLRVDTFETAVDERVDQLEKAIEATQLQIAAYHRKDGT